MVEEVTVLRTTYAVEADSREAAERCVEDPGYFFSNDPTPIREILLLEQLTVGDNICYDHLDELLTEPNSVNGWLGRRVIHTHEEFQEEAES